MLESLGSMSSDQFTAIAVGQPFPLQVPGEGLALMPGSGLSFVLALSGISEQEKNAFKRGSITYTCASVDGIPFIVMDFGVSSFDCYVNAYKMPDKDKASLMGDKDRNLIGLYVCEIKPFTGQCIVQSIRQFGADPAFVEAIGSALSLQMLEYDSAGAVDRHADAVMARYDTPSLARLDSSCTFSLPARKG